MEPTGTPVRHPLVRLIAIEFLISLALGLLPIFTRMLDYNFLPSYKWMSAANVLGLASGLVFAVAFLWIGLKGKANLPGSTLKKTVVIVAAPLFGFLMGKNAVLVSPPMILALVAGHQVETSFTVERANEYGSSRCRSPVELRHLPFLFNKVCRVSSQFRKAISQDAEVKVIGYGTDLGLFVYDIRRAS
jgi:hypothetical protein